MDPTRLMNIPATLTPYAPSAFPDEYNDDDLEPGTPVDTVCWFEQTARAENDTDNTFEDTFTLYLPPDLTVNPDDQITVGDDTFQIVGPPWTVTHPRTTQVTHLQATGRRVL